MLWEPWVLWVRYSRNCCLPNGDVPMFFLQLDPECTD
jgi:hypothetical protein